MAKTDWVTRFWAKVDRSGGPDACHRWMGAFNRSGRNVPRRRKGASARRPVFWIADGLVVYAHRLALSLHDGVPLDERAGLEACHHPTRCSGETWCVNPAHLYWGTPEENRDDRYGRPDATQAAFLDEGL